MESQVVSWPRWYARYNDLRVSFFAAGQSAALSKDLLGLRAFSDNDVHRPSLHRSLIHHRDDLLRFSARRSNAARSLRWLLSPASHSLLASSPHLLGSSQRDSDITPQRRPARRHNSLPN